MSQSAGCRVCRGGVPSWDGPSGATWKPHGPVPRCYRAGMGIPLSDATLRLVDGKNYAVLATVNPDGSPQTSVVWVGLDGSDLLFSTVQGRVKHRNMLERHSDRFGGPRELR